MDDTKLDRASLGSYLCAALMLMVLTLQFGPFWFPGEDAAGVSQIGYVWVPERAEDLELFFSANLNESPRRNEIAIMLTAQMITGGLGTVLCIARPKQRAVRLLPAFCGFAGMLGYMVIPALQIGSGAWIRWGLCVLLFAISLTNPEYAGHDETYIFPYSE